MSELELAGSHGVILPDNEICDDDILLFFVVVGLKDALVVVLALHFAAEYFGPVLVS